MKPTPQTTIKSLGGRVVGSTTTLFWVYVWENDGLLDFMLRVR